MLVQLLCPQRHCILAAASETEKGSYDATVKALSQRLEPTGPIRHHCGICGSIELHFEEGATKFRTMKEAMPFLAQTMVHNMATRGLMDANGMTYDVQKNN
jgi:hypothetical protein